MSQYPLEPFYDAMVTALAEVDACVEINSAGLQNLWGYLPSSRFSKCHRPMYPSPLHVMPITPKMWEGFGCRHSSCSLRRLYPCRFTFANRRRTLQPLVSLVAAGRFIPLQNVSIGVRPTDLWKEIRHVANRYVKQLARPCTRLRPGINPVPMLGLLIWDEDPEALPKMGC